MYLNKKRSSAQGFGLAGLFVFKIASNKRQKLGGTMQGIIIENIANLYKVAVKIPNQTRNQWGNLRSNSKRKI